MPVTATRSWMRLLLFAACALGCSPSHTTQPYLDGGVFDAGTPTDAGSDAGLVVDAGSDAGAAVDAGADAGPSDDAGSVLDGGPLDAGPARDSGPSDVGGPVDAGSPTDAGVGDEGSTSFPGLPGTDGGSLRALYVDSVSGSDSNSGDSPSTALQHINGNSALQKILKGATAQSGIEVLLKPGSIWTYELLTVPVGGTTGFPLLISGSRWPDAGSTARPQIRAGVRVTNGGENHVAIEGIAIGPYPGDFPADAGSTPSSIGVDISVPGGTDYLIEDCLITHFYNLIQASGSDSQPISDVRIRRSYLFGAYGSAPWSPSTATT